MSQSRHNAAILPFDSEEETPTDYVKHQRTITEDDVRETGEERVPKLTDEATPLQVLHFLTAFDRARTNLQWNTGPKLFQKFPMHLSQDHLDTWELAYKGAEETVDEFDASLEIFKSELIDGISYENQLDYLRNLKKPGKMTPSKFLLKLRAASNLAAQLPDAPDNGGFSDEQLRRVFLLAMPKKWQDNFEDANLTVHNTTLADMRMYMD